MLHFQCAVRVPLERHRKAVPLDIIHILSIPQGCHALQPGLQFTGTPSGLSKIAYQGEYLNSFFLNILHISYAAVICPKNWVKIEIFAKLCRP